MSFLRLPVSRLARVTLGKMLQSEETSPADREADYLRAAHVQPDGRIVDLNDEQRMWFKPGELSLYSLRAGDVVIVEGGAGYGRSAVLTKDLPYWGFQNSIIRLRPLVGVADGRFLDYALQSALADGSIPLVCSTATIPHFTAEKVARFPLPAPSTHMQRAIADFLDRETAKIDALIQKQSELVRLLRERKALSVSPRAGDRVGEGERSKRYFREVDSRAGAELAGLPLLSVSIDWGVLPRDESTSSQAASEDLARYKVVERGDIVVNRMRAFQGALGVAPSRGLASPDYAVLRVTSYVSPQWLASLMRSAPFVSEMVARLRGIGTIDGSNVRTPRVAVADIGEIRIVVPPLWLQHEEMAESASSAAKIDALIAKAEKFIALAKERRAALITAAVTGQIDVIREAS